MKRNAVGAVAAQVVQAGISFVLQLLVAQMLGVADYGRFAILYGVLVVATGAVTGLVGDSLVVLDRGTRTVRAGLEATLLYVATGVGVAGVLVAALSGIATWPEALLFGCALAAFATEEIVRRLLMANLRFHRVALTDLTGFAVALAVVLGAWALHAVSLMVFLAAIAAGQVVAGVVGWFLVPRADRVLVGLGRADNRAVWRYGTWRALQQTLRPALFTAVRLLVAAVAGLSAVGLLEGARTYSSPIILVVGGLSSFLFVRFADAARRGTAGSVREADRAAVLLLLLSLAMSAVALPLAPLLGELAFGFALDPIAVAAWLAYGVSVSIVTPYGALAAVSGGQTRVFLIRLADTAAGLIAAVVMLLLGVEASWIPLGLAGASLLGGVALRWIARSRGAAASLSLQVPDTAG